MKAKAAVRLRSYAKINFALNVTGTRGGYHLLDSVLASVDLYDTVTARPRKDGLINVYMQGLGSEHIPPEQNNAVRAGEAFVSAFGTCGADIRILKDIPMGAGLGGSSADAAGVLNALARLYGVEDRQALKALADTLGSDTGYMLGGGFARLSGRGERVEPLRSPRVYNFLLLVPSTPVSTAACFAAYDAAPDALRADAASLASALERGEFAGVAANVYNALERPACSLNPDVAAALEEARAFSPSACAVTGSGSAVFALFESEELCRWAKSRYRGKFRARVAKTVQPHGRPWRSPFVLDPEEPGARP